jgi:hypothetical protein
MTRFHGVFAPNSKHRARVTPGKRGKGANPKVSVEGQESTPAERPAALTWAQRLKRVFGIDIEICRACGGALRIVACIEDPVVIKKILAHVDRKNAPAGNGPVAGRAGAACRSVRLTSSPPLVQPRLLCRARQGSGYAEVRMVRAVTLVKADFPMLRAQRGRILGRRQGTGLVIIRELSELTRHLYFLYSKTILASKPCIVKWYKQMEPMRCARRLKPMRAILPAKMRL